MKPNPDFQQVIDKFTPHIQEIASDTRIFLFETLPNLNEEVDKESSIVEYTLSSHHKGLVCTMDLSDAGVTLGFYNGAELEDPEKILAGSALKYRYVEINDPAMLRSAILKDLVLDAVKVTSH